MKLKRKSQSWLHRVIAKLPFIPKTYMTRYFTTIRDTVYVPSRFDDECIHSAEWAEKHAEVLSHESIHIDRWHLWRTPVYELAYLGPSVALLPLGLLVLLLSTPWGLGLLGLAVLCAPLSYKYAYGRWFIEREAYLPVMRQAYAYQGMRSLVALAELVADKLERDYFNPWPHERMVAWFCTHGASNGGDQCS